MSHFGGGGGHGGHGGFGHHGGHHSGGHHSGGHPDQSPNWNSALQGERKNGKFLTSLPNPTVVPIILAFCVFMVMLLPFVIEWDWENLPWNKQSQSQDQEAQPEATASVQADRELLDATKNSMIQAQASARAAILKQQQMAAAEQAGVDVNAQGQSQSQGMGQGTGQGLSQGMGQGLSQEQIQQQPAADNGYQDQTQAQLQASQMSGQPQAYYPQNNYQPQQSGAPLTAAPGLATGYSSYDQGYGQGYQAQNYPGQSYDTSYSSQSYGSDRSTYTPTTPVGQHRFRVFAGR